MNYLDPVYVTLLAIVVLGEKLAFRRLMAVGVALLGAMIILRPGFREIETGHLAMLLTAVMFAIGYLIAKIMADEVEPLVVLGMLSNTVIIALAPFAFAGRVTPSFVQLALSFLVSVSASPGHHPMWLASRASPPSLHLPLRCR